MDRLQEADNLLAQAIAQIGWLFDQVAQASLTVSRVFDVGVTGRAGGCVIARDVSPGEDFTLQKV